MILFPFGIISSVFAFIFIKRKYSTNTTSDKDKEDESENELTRDENDDKFEQFEDNQKIQNLGDKLKELDQDIQVDVELNDKPSKNSINKNHDVEIVI